MKLTKKPLLLELDESDLPKMNAIMEEFGVSFSDERFKQAQNKFEAMVTEIMDIKIKKA